MTPTDGLMSKPGWPSPVCTTHSISRFRCLWDGRTFAAVRKILLILVAAMTQQVHTINDCKVINKKNIGGLSLKWAKNHAQSRPTPRALGRENVRFVTPHDNNNILPVVWPMKTQRIFFDRLIPHVFPFVSVTNKQASFSHHRHR